MSVDLIVAVDEAGGIGKEGGIPWDRPGDLKHFKAFTMGRNVIMGRRTWESLPKKPLPGRTNIVVTSGCAATGDVFSVSSLHSAIRLCKGDCVIMGGGRIYEQALEGRLAQRLVVTRVQGTFGCDTFLGPIPDDYVLTHVERFPGELFYIETYEYDQKT